jgi:adenine-specific DNA-methyltransferase
MDGKSLSITEEKLDKLKEIIPEAFTENKIDWEKLKAALGDDIEFKNERYVLNWAGKSDAFRSLQSPSTDTLVPCREESVNFETTGNIFIEGENLEVLKVLQKAYFGKIKMIYVDPPYNTGNDNFIYPDKFAESREEYLSRIGDKDETGLMTREGLFRKNSKDSGHYHSNWLSMMYPRLFLARNLLKDDGIIFVSIDENEVHNLRLIMNEIFGEENFLVNVVWEKRFTRSNNAKIFTTLTENILCYRKTDSLSEIKEPRNEKSDSIYSNPDNDERGVWTSVSYVNPATKEQRPNLSYPVRKPFTNKEIIHPTNAWKFEKKVYEKHLLENKLCWGQKGENKYPRLKKFLSEMEGGMVPVDLWFHKETGTTDKGSKELEKLLGGKYFDFPKPSSLIKRMLKISTSEEDAIILDFFSGTCPTAHAVLDLNKEDGGNRKFICVQLPEKCDENSEAFKAGYKTISEIGKERIRRVIKKIQEEQDGKLDLDGNGDRDLGFKVFKLKESNFKIWRSNVETEEELITQMKRHLEPLDENAKPEDVLYELLIKSGVQLTAKIKEKNGYILVNDNEVALMLEKADDKIIKQIIAAKPQKVFTLDRLFKNNDKLKTNTALQMKDAKIEFKVI